MDIRVEQCTLYGEEQIVSDSKVGGHGQGKQEQDNRKAHPVVLHSLILSISTLLQGLERHLAIQGCNKFKIEEENQPCHQVQW